MDHSNQTAKLYTRLSVYLIIGSALLLIIPSLTSAYVRYRPQSSLGSQSITSQHIKNGTIVGNDVASSTTLTVTGVETSSLTATGTSEIYNLTVDNTLTVTDITATGTITATDATFTNWPTMPAGDPVNGTDAVSKSYVDSASGVQTLSMNAGENIGKGQPVAISSTTITAVSLDLGDTTSGVYVFGDNSDRNEAAQKYNESGGIVFKTICYGLGKDGAPSDNVIVALKAEVSGIPAVADMYSTTTPASQIVSGGSEFCWQPDGGNLISTTSVFFLAFRRTGAASETDLFRTYAPGDTYANGTRWAKVSGSWGTAGTTDIGSRFLHTITPGLAFLATAQQYDYYAGFLGLAQATTSRLGAMTVDVMGPSTSRVGMIGQTTYYLGNATGTLSTTAGNYSLKVGKAASSTTILLVPQI